MEHQEGEREAGRRSSTIKDAEVPSGSARNSDQENSPIRVVAAAVNTTPLDWDNNLSATREALHLARLSGAKVVVLPELVLCGVGCEDAFFSRELSATSLSLLGELAPETQGMAVAVGLPLWVGEDLLSVAAFVVDGRVLGFAPRFEFPRDRVAYARRWFSPRMGAPFTPSKTVVVDFLGEALPLQNAFAAFGRNVFVSVGGDGLRNSAWLEGRDLCLDVNARVFSFSEQAKFERALTEAARKSGCAIASANLCGNEGGTLLYGGGALIASSRGQLLGRSNRFSFKRATVIASELGSSVPPSAPTDFLASKNEEFARAVSLGLFDYARKTRSSSFALSLSGGADSGAIACLVHLMVRYGVQELGSQGFIEAFGMKHAEEIPAFSPGQSGEGELEKCVRTLVRHLLITAYQGTANSSSISRDAALAVAQDVGSRHVEFAIDDLVDGYRQRTESAVSREFSWGQDDLTLQNIQARARGPSIWMIANAQNALLLTTSNRSEAAVGYATMDGDTCGGLAPIVGVDKAYLREWLSWLEVNSPAEGRPFPSLRHINAQAPTAELRPPKEKQTDEKDLMPYGLLDEIERLGIHQMHPPKEVLTALKARHPELELAQLKSCVARFFQMFARSQWKRNRCAPGFHLEEVDLSPVSWCRFPILNGGFSREIRQMESIENGGVSGAVER